MLNKHAPELTITRQQKEEVALWRRRVMTRFGVVVRQQYEVLGQVRTFFGSLLILLSVGHNGMLILRSKLKFSIEQFFSISAFLQRFVLASGALCSAGYQSLVSRSYLIHVLIMASATCSVCLASFSSSC